jgi:hypothetical protein
MTEWLYLAQLWFAVIAGSLLVFLGLIGRVPSGFSISLVALSEVGLFGQLVFSSVFVILGERAQIDTWEFFGYLLVALLIPVGGAIWALVERTRWSTLVMGAALLTLAVMLVRMYQIWTGINPVQG